MKSRDSSPHSIRFPYFLSQKNFISQLTMEVKVARQPAPRLSSGSSELADGFNVLVGLNHWRYLGLLIVVSMFVPTGEIAGVFFNGHTLRLPGS